MTRSRLLRLFVTVCCAFGLWLLLRDEPAYAPEPTNPSSPSAEPAPTEPEAAPVQRPPAEPERTQTPPPAPRDPGRTSPAAPGLRGFVKELQGDGLPEILVEQVDAEGRSLLSTTTDAAGRFAFDAMAPAATHLVTRPAPRGLPRLRHGMPRTSGPGGPGGLGGQGGAEIYLWRPPAGTIRGTVVDATGTPVADAAVATDRPFLLMPNVSLDVLEGDEPQPAFEARTDANGCFELPSARRGTHVLRAQHQGRSGSVKASPGDAGVVIRLGTHLGGDTVVSGQLTDQVTGAAIAGATVWVQHVRKTEGGSSSIGVGNTTTDPQGRYEVQGLDPGTYRVVSRPAGYARQEAVKVCDSGQNVLDLALLPARSLRVRVLLPGGDPARGAEVRVRDERGRPVQMQGDFGMDSSRIRVDADGVARLRALPAAPLDLTAVRGDLVPSARLQVDLRVEPPEELTIELPSSVSRFARKHYFVLLDEDGRPATFAGTVVARSFDGATLLSHVEGRWRGKEFVFGNDERHGFREPTIAVGAIAGDCRVEITVPGYRTETLVLPANAESPTRVRLSR